MLRRSAALAVAAGSLALALTACSPGLSQVAGTSTDVGMEHVHGLRVDPADGTLYAATHFGLFRVPENGEAERVADRHQDTTGFTVAGPRTFLGSGHPDSQVDPTLLDAPGADPQRGSR